MTSCILTTTSVVTAVSTMIMAIFAGIALCTWKKRTKIYKEIGNMREYFFTLFRY